MSGPAADHPGRVARPRSGGVRLAPIILLALCGCRWVLPLQAPSDGEPADRGVTDRRASETSLPDQAIPWDLRVADLDMGWIGGTWQYRRALIIDHTKVAADLTDFPLLVAINDATLTGKLHVQGGDLVVVVPGSSSGLEWELEQLDQAAGKLVFWVKVPAVSANQDTVLYLYYANPSGPMGTPFTPWGQEYAAVWHLSQAPTQGVQLDSTSNANDAKHQGTWTTSSLEPCQVGGCLDFDGVDDRLKVIDAPSLRPTQAITVSAWLNARTFPPNEGTVLAKAQSWGSTNFDVLLRGDGSYIGWVFYNKGPYPTKYFAPLTGAWHHMAGTYDGAAVRLYIDGQLVDSQPHVGSLAYVGQRPYFIGAFGWVATDVPGSESRLWNGQLDEIRILGVARSAAWIATEYSNQASPGTFYTLGPEERHP